MTLGEIAAQGATSGECECIVVSESNGGSDSAKTHTGIVSCLSYCIFCLHIIYFS